MGAHKEDLSGWEMHGLGWQCPPQGTTTGVLLFDTYCQLQADECTCKGKILLPQCTRGGTQQQFPKWLQTPPTKVDKELGLKAQEPSLPSPQQVWPGQQSSPCSPASASLPWLPSSCALGIRAVFVPRRQMAVAGAVPLGGGAWPPPATGPLNEKRPRYPWQRPSLRVACPELHISDCKLLLTASLPSLRLTS